MIYVVYAEDTKELLALIDTNKNHKCACREGIAFRRYDEDMDPIFIQTEDDIYLKENATIYNDLMRTKR